MEECLLCKRHYSQNGECRGKWSWSDCNCIHFELEPRGRKMRDNVTFAIRNDADTPIVKPNAELSFTDNGKTLKMQVKKINWIDMERMLCNVEVEFFETEQPKSFKKKKFRILKNEEAK